MTLRFAAAAGLLMALSACVGPPPGQVFQAELSPLIGRPATEAFARLGIPDEEGVVAGMKYYEWSNAGIGTGSMAVPSTTTAFVGKSVVSIHNLDTQLYSYSYQCNLRIFVNDANVITHWDHKGDRTGCDYYADRLRVR